MALSFDRLDRKEKTLSLGVYPAVSLKQARITRDAARAMVAQGEDPSEAKQEQKRLQRETNGQTFAKLAKHSLQNNERKANQPRPFPRQNTT
ncbi:Arm DNA-binding domain-containing protein [Roseovarius sp. EL26]|uniref:Arm DNA-binding domain-containing protein n=1 Tax=Roseovarius sp. EL26 TaxID=2126672 RepID=UPI0020B15D91|nr:Arm DNA-binding domain-containing protein [Roseovarius sp. EL26]